jgi:hypothetical protein
MLLDLRRSILLALGFTGGMSGCAATSATVESGTTDQRGTVSGSVCRVETPGSARVLACSSIEVEREGGAALEAPGAVCQSSLDCLSHLCVMPPTGESATCAANACPACGAGEVCAPFYARAALGEDQVPTPGVAPPRSSTAGVDCFPMVGTTKTTYHPDSSPCRMGSTTSCVVEDGDWVCSTPSTNMGHHMCGRALYVDAVPALASNAASGGWSPSVSVDLGLDGRSNMGVDAWARRIPEIAFEEHASIAAFARTIAELLALGAPHALVAETAAALTDEIEHARLAFELANQAGAAVDPGPFPGAVAPLTGRVDLREALLDDVVRGGCVGETLAVLEALAWRERLRGGAAAERTRAFLDRVVEDETRHAALAFKTAAWLIQSAPGGDRARLRDTALATIDAPDAPSAVRDMVRSIAAIVLAEVPSPLS